MNPIYGIASKRTVVGVAVYSTVCSSGLAAKLNSPSTTYESLIFDPEKIERRLLESGSGIDLAKRFFPISMGKWAKENPTPAALFSEDPEINCANCGADLLKPKPRGIVVIWTGRNEHHKEHVHNFYTCCKGGCDDALRLKHRGDGVADGWEDIDDIAIPQTYLRWCMATMNKLREGMTYSDEAFESEKSFMMNLFPYVAREMTSIEEERLRRLSAIPKIFGGWGD
jgi:hypothetical protein